MEKKNMNKKALVAASVAGLLAVTGAIFSGTAMAEQVPCYGANACKGTGACGGKNNACAGKNSCKGQGFVNVDNQEACTKLNGTLTPAA